VTATLRALPTNRTELAAIRTAQQLADTLHLSRVPISQLHGQHADDGIHLRSCPVHRGGGLITPHNTSDRLQLGPCCATQPATNLITSIPRGFRSVDNVRAAEVAKVIAGAADACADDDPWSISTHTHFLQNAGIDYCVQQQVLNRRLRWIEPILVSVIDTELAARTTLGPLTILVGTDNTDALWGSSPTISAQLLRSRSGFRYPGHTVLVAVDAQHRSSFTSSGYHGDHLRPLLTADTADNLDSAAHTLRTLLVDHRLDNDLLSTVAALHPGVTADPAPGREHPAESV
jgi:hypothetical protein